MRHGWQTEKVSQMSKETEKPGGNRANQNKSNNLFEGDAEMRTPILPNTTDWASYVLLLRELNEYQDKVRADYHEGNLVVPESFIDGLNTNMPDHDEAWLTPERITQMYYMHRLGVLANPEWLGEVPDWAESVDTSLDEEALSVAFETSFGKYSTLSQIRHVWLSDGHVTEGTITVSILGHGNLEELTAAEARDVAVELTEAAAFIESTYGRPIQRATEPGASEHEEGI